MISQILPVNKFEWIEETSQFNEDFIKNYNEESDARHFVEDDVKYLEELQKLHNDLPFSSERSKLGNTKKLATNLHDKTKFYTHNKFKAKIKSCSNFEKNS